MRAVPSVGELVERAVADDQRALALTDHNVLIGAVAFDRACRRAGIKPIIGLTIDTPLSPGAVRPDGFAPVGELTLLARNEAGYRSLCRLSSISQTTGEAAEELSWDALKAHREGLLCLTGGRKGWLERYLRAGHLPGARRWLSRLGGLYGEHCFVAISGELLAPHLRPQLDALLELAENFGMKSVAVQPIYCLGKEDLSLLPLMAAIRTNTPVAQVDVAALPGYGESAVRVDWPSQSDLLSQFSDHPELLAATEHVAGLVEESVMPSGTPIWPVIRTRDGKTPEAELKLAAAAGLSERYVEPVSPEVAERLARELEVIDRAGFAPLFLLVADLVGYARHTGIPVSTRGSVANSLVAFVLGITTVDPIAHDLLFERFLNPARSGLPDIDLDFCSRRRDELLDYVRRTYGEERVALVATVNTLQPRSAVRETGKAYGLDESQLRRLARQSKRSWHPDPRRRERSGLDDLLTAATSEQERAVLIQAFRLIGQPDHLGIHPGGLIITPGPLTDLVPVQLAAKGFLTTQFEHKDVEAIGLPKLDLLGIRALTVLTDTVELVRQGPNPQFRLEDIPLNDQTTGDLLAAGETIGVFQCESDGARRTLRQLRARTVAQLADASAFFKPGPATGGMAQAFIRRYRDQEPVTYLHPSLQPILKRTKGVLLFQEQVLRVVTEIAGLSWAEADQIRRGISKFDAERIEALSQAFQSGCRRPAPDGPGMTALQAAKLWEQVLAFAGYGFNQGHATAYADVSYRSAFMKAHWPAEFLCARLAGAGGFHHPAIYMAEARRLGIEVRPPHVNHSQSHFTLEHLSDAHEPVSGPVLWMGLGQVRGLRQAAVGQIIGAREQELFRSLADLVSRVDLRSAELESLIQCGALDGLGHSRSVMLDEASLISRSGSSRQMAFGFASTETVLPDTVANRLAWEMEILGLPVASNPLALVVGQPNLIPLANLPGSRGRMVAVLAYRLPGWTGSSGYFFSDGNDFVTVRFASEAAKSLPEVKPWLPLELEGRWMVDEWQGGWLQVDKVRRATVLE